jgi:hypothetical protein
MIGVPVMHTRDCEVNEEPEPRMRRARLRKRLFQ